MAHSRSNDTTRVEKTAEGMPSPQMTGKVFDQITFFERSNSPIDPIIIPVENLADSNQVFRSKAAEYEQEITSRNAFIGSLNDLDALKLPVGLQRQVGPINYTVIISKVTVTLTGSFIEAYFMFELPQTGDKIAFRGDRIKFSNKGGFSGVGRLELIGNYPVKISDKTLVTVIGQKNSMGQGNSFVEFDCNGFKQMGLEAEVEFSRDLIIPEDETGKQKAAPERVKTRFVTTVQSWNDLLLGVTLPPFQVNGLKDVGFSVSEAYLDWSDLANPSGITFPTSYTSPFISSGQYNLWQGFYIKQVDVKLPPSFTRKDAKGRLTMGAENMILDAKGFTGKVFVENVLANGDMSGWAYSIDKVALELVVNQVKGFELDGTISIPRIKKKNDESATHFGYVAQRGADGNYIFAVKVDNNLRLPFLMADLNLGQGSSVVVKEKDGNFYPTAILNGDLTIKNTGKGINPNFNQIRFQGMRISTEEPNFDIQALGMGSSETHNLNKFPVVLSALSVKKDSKRIGLGFNLTINVGGKASEEGFGGTATLTVWGKEVETPVKNNEGAVVGTDKDWQFDNIDLSGVAINISKKDVYELNGSILFFNADPVYGDGFSGKLTGSISKFGGIEATAVFGKTEQFRYWYADGLVTLKTGVPLVPGVLFATGFGGGFYSKMKQTDKSPGSAIGQTKSGIYYVPDEKSLGIKAVMNVGAARQEAMNGNVGLEVAMNSSGGINWVTLTGNANFMSFTEMAESKLKELAGASATGKLAQKLIALTKGQVFGSMEMTWDNLNDSFHGNIEIYVNVAAGLLRGVSDGNKAGWAVLHFEKSDWYILVGTPDQPIGLEVARIFKASSYFMMGKNIPGSAPPPSQVIEILGHSVDTGASRNIGAIQTGDGFAFGLSFIVDTGDLKFLMFYGRFAAGMGIDFMLMDHGNSHCEGSSGKMGIDGWYAEGQAYAFVLGKIGVKVNLKFYKGNYDILSVRAAALLQAKGPNPFWMKGIVGGDFSILGGLVKGNCKFEVTVGKDCKPVGEQNLLGDVQMIAEISPAPNSKAVDVFTAPQVAFNIPIGETFTIRDLEEKTHTFRAVLDQFTVNDGTTALSGSRQWNRTNDVVIFAGDEILPGEKTLKVKAKLTFEEFINNAWAKVTFEGKIVEETAETSFETAKAPDYIPPSNVTLTYPLAGQVNFYPKEYNQGFIQLKQNQSYLFSPGQDWKQKIRMTDPSTFKYIESDFAYNSTSKKVTFTIPSGFENGKVYMFEVLNIPAQTTVIDANVKAVETKILSNPDAGGDATLTTKDITEALDRREVKTLFTSNFRTSNYNTFVDKMKAITLGQSFWTSVDRYAFILFRYLNGDEIFDAAELSGIMNTDKLIKMEAILDGNKWYANYPYPRLYEAYPYNGWKVSRKNPDMLGVPPIRDVKFTDFTQSLQLSEGDMDFTPVAFTGESITYNLGQSVDQDYQAIKKQAVNYIVDQPERINDRISALVLKSPPYIRYGPYKIKLSYVTPGVDKPTSTYEIEFFNYVPDED